MRLLPVTLAPPVSAHANAFRNLFEEPNQFQYFQHSLTDLVVMTNKTLANITRCSLTSAKLAAASVGQRPVTTP